MERVNVRGVVLAFVAVFVSGCDVDKFEERQNWGTTLGYHCCLKRNETVGLSNGQVGRLCRIRHERKIEIDVVGKGGYSEGRNFFAVTIHNTSVSHRITSVKVFLEHVDNKNEAGEPKVELLSNDSAQIDPGFTEKINFLPEFVPTEGRIKDENGESLFKWGVAEVRGLKLAIR